MDRLFLYIAKEADVISKAPFTFISLLVIASLLAYAAVKWRYSSIIEQVKAQNETLEARLHLKTEQTESYKERALKYDEKALEVVDSSEVALKEKSLDFVKNLREFVERYKREDEAIQNNDWLERHQNNSEEENNKRWNKFTNASSRLSNDRNSEYTRRFKVDAILLRDELRSRLPKYVPKDTHRESAYEHPTNYFGFNDVADDIEIMAKSLVTASKPS
ncbi:hypothetical protein [Psychrobacter faecalis]|uniref:hypothetical protein n=1 Tax=Psychrobacter faecalis TaxID=180588 RepID=UPI00191A5790|nr:hypothetical protein [Psychrobacter faecalis]